MSKLLKAITKKHRPAIAAKMTSANGYDEKKHTHPASLHKAGIISDNELADLQECIDDLAGTGSMAAKALNNVKPGTINKDRLNDADFVKSLMALDSDVGDDADSDDESGDESVTA